MRAFTVAEIVVLFLMMAVLCALVYALAVPAERDVNVKAELALDAKELAREFMRASMDEMKKLQDDPESVMGVGHFEAQKTECMNNVRNIIGLLVVGGEFPKKHGGAGLILQLVTKGEIEGEDNLGNLFCPGDRNESLEDAGGVEAYANLDLTSKGEYDHLTSYAGRDQTNKEYRAVRGSRRAVALVCDDSEDHHGKKGFVLGYSDGAVKFRRKFEDWQIDVKTPVLIGEGSVVKDLECMQAD